MEAPVTNEASRTSDCHILLRTPSAFATALCLSEACSSLYLTLPFRLLFPFPSHIPSLPLILYTFTSFLAEPFPLLLFCPFPFPYTTPILYSTFIRSTTEPFPFYVIVYVVVFVLDYVVVYVVGANCYFLLHDPSPIRSSICCRVMLWGYVVETALLRNTVK